MKRKDRLSSKSMEAIEKIGELLEDNPNGPYTHNLIGMYLGTVAEKDGRETVNRVIRDMSLDVLYGFKAA